MKIREFFSIVPAFLASAALLAGCSPSQGPGMTGEGRGGAGMLSGSPMLEGGMKTSLPRTFDDTDAGKTESPVLDVDFKVCRVRNGTCKEINTGKFETFSGVPVPVGSTINTVFVSKNLMSVGLDGKITKAVAVPSIATTGFEAVFTPIVDKNGRIRVAFTLDDSNLKEIKTLKNGAQYPVVDKALVKSGTLDLSSGERKSVDLGKGFRMTVFAKEVIE